MHVFDISHNQLTGPLPSFLDFTNVPEYAQRGIFISVSVPLYLPFIGLWPCTHQHLILCDSELERTEYCERRHRSCISSGVRIIIAVGHSCCISKQMSVSCSTQQLPAQITGRRIVGCMLL